jgi:NAD(P)-dependent dehydrogenase (short-subunit alcohol dehydrogenase family)
VRTVVVTGGTGALGRANVEAFVAGGDRVVVSWLDKRERDEVAARWADATGRGQVELIEADVADADAAARVARAAGDAEVLVNGVGGFGGGTPVHETDLDLWDRLYRINVRTAAAMSRALLPEMLRRRRGAIINVASRAALDCPATLAAYNAAKAGVIALTRTLHDETRDARIRVNAIVPTTIDTPANREAMPDADFSTWTPPEAIARVIRWLASEDASTVRGALLDV